MLVFTYYWPNVHDCVSLPKCRLPCVEPKTIRIHLFPVGSSQCNRSHRSMTGSSNAKWVVACWVHSWDCHSRNPVVSHRNNMTRHSVWNRTTRRADVERGLDSGRQRLCAWVWADARWLHASRPVEPKVDCMDSFFRVRASTGPSSCVVWGFPWPQSTGRLVWPCRSSWGCVSIGSQWADWGTLNKSHSVIQIKPIAQWKKQTQRTDYFAWNC